MDSVLTQLLEQLALNQFDVLPRIIQYLKVGRYSPTQMERILSKYINIDNILNNLSQNIELLPAAIISLSVHTAINEENFPKVSLRTIKEILNHYITIDDNLIWDAIRFYPLGTTTELLYAIDTEIRSRDWQIDDQNLAHRFTLVSDERERRLRESQDHRFPSWITGNRFWKGIIGEYSSPFEGHNQPFLRAFWPSILVKGIESPVDLIFEDDLGWQVVEKSSPTQDPYLASKFYAGPVLNINGIRFDCAPTEQESGTPRIVISINNIDKVLDLLQRLGIKIQKREIYGSGLEILQSKDFD